MRKKIIEIIGAGMEPERAELKTDEILKLFNEKVLLNDFLVYIYANFPDERLNHKALRSSMMVYLGEEDK